MDSIRKFLKRMNRKPDLKAIMERYTDRAKRTRYARLTTGQVIRIGHVV